VDPIKNTNVLCVSRPSADGCAILLRNGLDDADKFGSVISTRKR